METENSFIFDLDGTVVDTQTRFHATAESIVLERYCNVYLKPEDISSRFAGIPTVKVFKELDPDCNASLLVSKKWKVMLSLLNRNIVTCMPGMYELISILKEKDIDFAIASASPMDWIERCLRNTKSSSLFEKAPLLDMFYLDRIFSAEDCKNPKPAPDVFLKAQHSFSKTIEDSNKNTFVVGDGRADVIGAISGGFNVLYLSENNQEFDKNIQVKRFQTSLELSNYIIKELI